MDVALAQSSFDVPRELIEKYSGQGPRYTSYPTAVEFHEGFSAATWQKTLLAWRNSTPTEPPTESRSISLYTHIPFCRSLCYFCACHKIITEDRTVVSPYLAAISRELSIYSQLLSDGNTSLAGLHWGGGSPNYLAPDEMRVLFESTLAAFPKLNPAAEISIEMDPRTTTTEQLSTIERLGFNRISLGVQDFSPHVQEAVNRIQPFELTRDLVENARQLGLSGINLDLIYGLPGQELTSFNDTLSQVISIRPERIALYGYAHVTWIKKVQKALERHPLPSPSLRIELFRSAVTELTRAGYVYIGMDHFALPADSLAKALANGTLTRNFMGYSTECGAGTLGVGPSAISGLAGAYAQNEKDLQRYQAKLTSSNSANSLPITRGLSLSREDKLRAEVISQILCQGTVSFEQVGKRWEIDFAKHFAAELGGLEELEQDRLVAIEDSQLRLTPLGRFFMRSVAMHFDGYLNAHLTSGRKVFSQTV